jgi:hypothetical protein
MVNPRTNAPFLKIPRSLNITLTRSKAGPWSSLSSRKTCMHSCTSVVIRLDAGPHIFLLSTIWYLWYPSFALSAYPKSASSSLGSSSSGSNHRTQVEFGSCPSKNFLFMRLKCFLSVLSERIALSPSSPHVSRAFERWFYWHKKSPALFERQAWYDLCMILIPAESLTGRSRRGST